GAGHSEACRDWITVAGTTDLTVNCSAIPSASADGSCQAAVPNVLSGVTVSDGCSAARAITVIQSPVAGTLVGLGSHTITVTATDDRQNVARCTTVAVGRAGRA